MNIGWPQGIYLALAGVQVIKTAFKHGQLKHEWYSRYNIGVVLFDMSATFLLLYWGGFFGD